MIWAAVVHNKASGVVGSSLTPFYIARWKSLIRVVCRLQRAR